MRTGGRKIKRSSSLYGNRRKNKIKSIFAIIFTVIIAGALIFLGYSIGEPVINFFKNWGNSNTSQSEPWSPSDVATDESESSSETTSKSENSGSQNPDIQNYSAFRLSVNDIKSVNSLNSAVQNAKLNGFTAVIAPLKADGGMLYYKSTASLAVIQNLVASDITAKEIVQTIKQNNMIAIADIQVLKDNLSSVTTKEAGYTFEGTDSAWYDNSVEKGGKPWLSPFSVTAKQYLSEISSEISSAGFDMVICSDVIFPPFRNSDLNYIGQTVKDPNRYKALIDVVNTFFSDTSASGSKLSLKITAKDIIEGTSEVFKPDELPQISVVVSFNISEYNKINVNGNEIILTDMNTYDKVKTILQNVKAKSGSMTVIPCIEQTNMDSGQISEATKAITDLGYTTYFIN